eukprot:2349868-Amphidinium_carterae.1
MSMFVLVCQWLKQATSTSMHQGRRVGVNLKVARNKTQQQRRSKTTGHESRALPQSDNKIVQGRG